MKKLKYEVPHCSCTCFDDQFLVFQYLQPSVTHFICLMVNIQPGKGLYLTHVLELLKIMKQIQYRHFAFTRRFEVKQCEILWLTWPVLGLVSCKADGADHSFLNGITEGFYWIRLRIYSSPRMLVGKRLCTDSSLRIL